MKERGYTLLYHNWGDECRVYWLTSLRIRISFGTSNGGTEADFRRPIEGAGFPGSISRIHTALCRRGTWNIWWEMEWCTISAWHRCHVPTWHTNSLSNFYREMNDPPLRENPPLDSFLLRNPINFSNELNVLHSVSPRCQEREFQEQDMRVVQFGLYREVPEIGWITIDSPGSLKWHESWLVNLPFTRATYPPQK